MAVWSRSVSEWIGWVGKTSGYGQWRSDPDAEWFGMVSNCPDTFRSVMVQVWERICFTSKMKIFTALLCNCLSEPVELISESVESGEMSVGSYSGNNIKEGQYQS
jgi:hypothetical protein